MEPATAVPIATAARPPLVSAAPETAGERRHVVVMFCDLVDSTGIGAPRWRGMARSGWGIYRRGIDGREEMGGKVAKKLGDGLMALFGYPVAQENDAERAVRAALAIQRALADLNGKNADTGKPALAARIAIDWGRWWWMHRAKYSATCQISRREPRPGRAGFGRRDGAGAASDGRSLRRRGSRQP